MPGFLEEYFARKAPEQHILIWTDRGKRSSWFADAAAADAFAAKFTDRNIYFGLGITGQAYKPFERTSTERVVALTSVWVDLDYRSGGHKGDAHILPDRDAAQAVLDALPLKPSGTIFSGGGLHAHWLLDTLLPAEARTDKERAVALVQGWQEVIRRVCQERYAASLDATHDLARVLRVPGTPNCKSDPPVYVEIVEWEPERRYRAEDILEWCDHREAPVSLILPGDYVSDSRLTFDPSAKVPFELYEALRQIEPNFDRSFQRTRTDLADKTASGFDLSLSNYAVQAGWDDQEIVNLLIASGAKHGEVMKRPSYYERTIATARRSVEKLRAHENIEDFVLLGERAVRGGIESDDEMPPLDESGARNKMLEDLSTILNIALTRVIKYASDPPSYRLETPLGNIMLPSVDHLIGQAKFRSAIAAATGCLIDEYKPAKWHSIAQALLKVCEVADVGTDATDGGSVADWVSDYLRSRKPLEDDLEAKEQRWPYRKEGRVYLFMSDFVQWIFLRYGERHSAKSLGPRFRVFGADTETVSVPGDTGRRTTTTVWRMPPGV